MSLKTERREESQADAKVLDAVALPLIAAGVGVAEAYRRALATVRIA